MKITTKPGKKFVATVTLNAADLERGDGADIRALIPRAEFKEVADPAADRVELSLSRREAEVLWCLMGRVSGPPFCLARRVASRLYHALDEAIGGEHPSSSLEPARCPIQSGCIIKPDAPNATDYCAEE